jgi:TP901-1 family phage major tail protein
MAVIHGNAVGIFVDPAGGSDPAAANLVACATSASFSLNNATFEATCKADTAGALDDASVRHLGAGQQSWSMSVDGLVDLTAGAAGTESYVDLVQLALDRTEILVVFSDATTGNKQYYGKGYISSVEATASVDDFVTYSCSIDGTGELTAADVPA